MSRAAQQSDNSISSDDIARAFELFSGKLAVIVLGGSLSSRLGLIARRFDTVLTVPGIYWAPDFLDSAPFHFDNVNMMRDRWSIQDGSADAVFIHYSQNEQSDREFREAHRVLREGGTFAALTEDLHCNILQNNPLRALGVRHLRDVSNSAGQTLIYGRKKDSVLAGREGTNPAQKMFFKSNSDAEWLNVILTGQREGVPELRELSEFVASAGLHVLSTDTSARELAQIFRISHRMAERLYAVLRLTRSRNSDQNIQCASVDQTCKELQAADVEQIRILYFNDRDEVVGSHVAGTGSRSAVSANIQTVLRHAIEYHASKLIALHNHPSGSLTPSAEDIAMTAELARAAELLGLKLLDHIIISRDGRKRSLI